MRLLARSPTNRRPRESKASACGTSNSPGPDPCFPHCLTYFPSLVNFTMRALPMLGVCPSETRMSPLGAIATSLGWLKEAGSPGSPPGLPSVMSTFPSGENLNAWKPLPSRAWPSVTQILPSLSTQIPCGKINMPEPKLLTRLPEGSNLSTGSSVLPAQLLAPHRSATQMLLPSRSISTALVDPHILASGSFAQFSIVRYGLGYEFCAERVVARTASTPIVLIFASRSSLH